MKKKKAAKREQITTTGKRIKSTFRLGKLKFFSSGTFWVSVFISFVIGIAIGAGSVYSIKFKPQIPPNEQAKEESYWFVLHRKSNKEFLYEGVPGNKAKSKLIKTFKVKSGIPGEKPTPLPHLLNRKYWLIVGKLDTRDNPETSPYFLFLDIPISDTEPYGPEPYFECSGQCNWSVPGAFGLHGVNGDGNRLSEENPGSSGCIRHSDEDITFLYRIIDPRKEAVRYYIEDI